MSDDYHRQILKPGDLCVVVASTCSPRTNPALGQKVRVLDPESAAPPLRQIMQIAELFSDHRCYLVQSVAGHPLPVLLCASCLRKLEPPKETGTWEQIERWTGWTRPADVGAPV